MAATRLIPMHVNKGKTLAQSLGDRTDYAKNPEKTDKGELVTGYQCDPMTVDLFLYVLLHNKLWPLGTFFGKTVQYRYGCP